jgi:hypothetical protein
MLRLGLLSFMGFVHHVAYQVEHNILETGSVSEVEGGTYVVGSEMSSLSCWTAVFGDVACMYEN